MHLRACMVGMMDSFCLHFLHADSRRAASFYLSIFRHLIFMRTSAERRRRKTRREEDRQAEQEVYVEDSGVHLILSPQIEVNLDNNIN